jgi:chromosome segregation ATPase
MRLSALATILWLGVSQFLCGQSPRFQEQENMDHERRIARLEADRAALKEDMKNATDEILKLRASLKEVRQQASSAVDASKTANDDIGEIKWVGRGIMGAVAFLVGVVVTQWISKLMAVRKSRVVRVNAA